MNKTGIILLSGGLDSLVSLDIARKKCTITRALTFDYGQKAFHEEKLAAIEICKYYKVQNEIIELPFLKKMLNNALTNPNNDELDNFNSVWIPNRNGLFLNIAASYCDNYNIDYIIFGANKEEARDFDDNSKDFVEIADNFFKYATLKNPQVYAPCIDMDKTAIVNYAIENNTPLKFLKSCYNSKENTNKKHCGKCMSCKLLYNAILNSKNPDLIKEIF